MSERCESRSPATGLPCTRKRGHEAEPMGRLHLSSDARGWSDDPWSETAPQQTAPDAGEGIVGVLLSVLMDEYGGTPEDWTAMRSLARVERAVARLIEDAVAERLAGVEALVKREADNWWDEHNEAADGGLTERANIAGMVAETLDDLRSAVRRSVETSRQAPRNGPGSDDGAIRRVSGRSESDEAASEEKR